MQSERILNPQSLMQFCFWFIQIFLGIVVWLQKQTTKQQPVQNHALNVHIELESFLIFFTSWCFLKF